MKRTAFLFAFTMYSITCLGQILDSTAIDGLMWDPEWSKPSDPGYALGIFKDGNVLYSKGYGLANLEYAEPITSRSVFRIASVSKQFTAACVVLLIQRDQLGFDDTLDKFFPAFPDYAKRISIRNLLHHTSGLRDYQTLANLKGLTNEDYYDDQQILDWLTSQKGLTHEPGEQYRYCNSGYWLLAKIVEKVTRTDFADFAHKEIFAPLEMNNTHFHNDFRRVIRNRATGYGFATSGHGEYEIRETNLSHLGNGGMYSTIEDLKKWDDTYYDSDSFNQDFWSVMTQKGTLNSGEELKYGCGLNVFEYNGLDVIGHGGSLGSQAGFRSQYIRFPSQRLSIVILANRSDADPWSASSRIANTLLKDHFVFSYEPSTQVESRIINPSELVKFEGNYWNRAKESRCTISIKDDTLMYDDTMKGSYKLIPIAKNEFYKLGKSQHKVKFQPANDNRWMLLENIDGQIETLTAFKPKHYSINQLVAFLGEYYSEELETTYSLRIKEDNLALYIRDRFISNIEPVSDNMFLTYDNGVFYFSEDDFGQIKGFRLEYFLTRIGFVRS